MLHNPDRQRFSPGRRIAVVGAGVAGLSAAWLLSRRHEVVLYESEGRVGGHANTVDVATRHGTLAVDTGFIVYNPLNYPNFTALLDHLGVGSVPTTMSFATSIGNGDFEYSSSFPGIVGQKRNLARPRFWRMLADIVKFYGHAEALIESPDIEGVTLGQFLDRHGYSGMLVDNHILPMCAAIWSSAPDQMRAFPMRAFLRFFASHNLFAIGAKETWRTVEGGSRAYVTALAAALEGSIRTGTPVRRIAREAGFITVEDGTGGREVFTDIVLAGHADQSLALLSDADREEREVLGAFRYSDNRAVLHDDRALMPRRRSVWASWNYIGEETETADRALCVSYWMNKLQGLDPRHPLFVTLNPIREPKESPLTRSFSYTHPIFDQAALEAQRRLWSLQGRHGTWFCGSYFGYGFHEDALQSGLAVAERFGVRRPWTVPAESGRIASDPSSALAAP